MADLKISQLSAATALAGTEVVPVVQSGSTKKATINQILSPAAGKGIDYSANTPAAGMTSQLLNWYEEGTWTPSVSAQTGSLTTVSSSGTYVRIGTLVSVEFTITISNAGTGSGVLIVSNLPFTPANGDFAGTGRSNTQKATVWTFWGSSSTSTVYYDGTTVISTGQTIQSTITYRV